MTLGTTIATLREKNNMTQQDLAKMLNFTPQAVSKWENDASEPKLETIREIAKLFNVSISEILGEDVKEEIDNDNVQQCLVPYVIEEVNTSVSKKNAIFFAGLYSIFFSLFSFFVMHDAEIDIVISISTSILMCVLIINFYYKSKINKVIKTNLYNYQCNIYFLSNFINRTNGLFIFLFKLPFLLIDFSVYLIKIFYLVIKSLFYWRDNYE